MPEAYYEILALGARYWFVLLGVMIVLRAFLWLRKDRREKHRRLRQLPDAGTIGEMVVLEGSEELPEGEAIPVPWEGVMGFVRGCDLIVPVNGVAPKHCDVSFKNGVGLMVFPYRGCTAEVDGELVTNRRSGTEHPMHHGSILKIGEATLRLRVFMGLETDRPATMQADDDEMPQQTESSPTNVIYHQVPASWEQPYGGSANWQPMQEPNPLENQAPAYPPYSYPVEVQTQEASPVPEEPETTKRHWIRRRDRHA